MQPADATTRAAAVLYVADLARMRAFYENCLSFTAVDGGDDFCVLESAAWTLTMVASPAARAAAPSARRENTPIKLVFTVDTLEPLRPVIETLGGTLDQAATAWEFRGVLHCDGTDPEGNVLQWREPRAGQADPGPGPA